MSNMEATWRRPFSVFTSSLTNSFCLNIHPVISTKKIVFDQKQLTYQKVDTFLYILDNLQDKNCDKGGENWP